MSRVSIVGSGYVGLVTGAGLAELGHHVVCVDVDRQRVEIINDGLVPFHEPGLEELTSRHAGQRLWATTDLKSAVWESDVTFIAVGTPGREDGGIDLDQVIEAAHEIGQAMAVKGDQHVVVTKSTVVPGTTVGTIVPTLETASRKRAGQDFGVAVNPEFLTEGTAVADFLQPDRIVIGALDDDETTKSVVDLYAPLGDVPLVLTHPSTAELIKYASNTLLATMISFSNELANLAEELDGVDIVDVMRGVHNSRYLTTDGSIADIASFLAAGCGFGGSCLPKDTRALIALGRDLGVDAPLLRAVLDVNRGRSERVVQMIQESLGGIRGKAVAVLGLAFKPDTDDVRESPAFPIVDSLLHAGARVFVHDPKVKMESLSSSWRGRVEHHSDLHKAVAETDAVILVTKWDEYRRLPDVLSSFDPPPLFIDGRRLLDPDSVPAYEGIGR